MDGTVGGGSRIAAGKEETLVMETSCGLGSPIKVGRMSSLVQATSLACLARGEYPTNVRLGKRCGVYGHY